MQANTVEAGRDAQRGFSLAIVAVALVTLLAVSALAIDLAALYVARNEAQGAADAAALAGAKVFVETGFISGLSSQAANVQSLARTRAIDVTNENQIAGQNVMIADADVSFNADFSPSKALISVIARRSNISLFFSRIWPGAASSVSAMATAEAFNPSGTSVSTSIGVSCLKPVFVSNCDPNHTSPSNNSHCGSGASGPNFAAFFNSDGTVANPGLVSAGGIVGMQIAFDYQNSTPRPFALLDLGGGPSQFTANTTNCSSTVFQCRASNPSLLTGNRSAELRSALESLIHAGGDGLGRGQDSLVFNNSGNPPFTITGGDNHPNLNLRGVAGINNSDSIVILPVYDDEPKMVIGFLQVFITSVQLTGGGNNVVFNGVILNAFGCGGFTGTGGTMELGPGGSPFLVRLVHQ